MTDDSHTMSDNRPDQDAVKMIIEALHGLSRRIERIEGILMSDDEYTPRHLMDKISNFIAHAEKMEDRVVRLEASTARMAGAIGLVVLLLPPLTAIFNPLFRKLLGL